MCTVAAPQSADLGSRSAPSSHHQARPCQVRICAATPTVNSTSLQICSLETRHGPHMSTRVSLQGIFKCTKMLHSMRLCASQESSVPKQSAHTRGTQVIVPRHLRNALRIAAPQEAEAARSPPLEV